MRWEIWLPLTVLGLCVRQGLWKRIYQLKNKVTMEQENINLDETPADAKPDVSGSGLLENCTRKEALTYFGFKDVGPVSIRGNKYSKCVYNDKLNVFAVQFMWLTSYHIFMSRDEKIQRKINKVTGEMWHGADVIRNFNSLSKRLDVLA